MTVPDITTSSTWSQQASGLPPLPPPIGKSPPAPGLAWAGGDYDELHDQFYLFGGASTAQGSTSSGLEVFSNQVTEVIFASDSTVSSNPPPALVPYSNRHFYASWAKPLSDASLGGFFPPQAMTGTSFTYGVRRDPSMKTNCMSGDVVPSLAVPTATPPYTGTCGGSLLPANGAAVATNEQHDYYLLQGGMTTTGLFSKNMYLYKPHGFSNDIGTSATATPISVGGDWNLVSNVTAPHLSSKVMRIVDVGLGPNISTQPYITTEIGSPRQQGDIFSGWLGRAYHKTVYDPGMNRFYTFGGLENHNAHIGAGLPATSVAPDLAISDVWIYDPPQLGRRPNSVCFSTEMPDGTLLNNPLNPFIPGLGRGVKPMGAVSNLNANSNYAQAPFVFPPGGCMQRIKIDNIAQPPARFAHGQVFDPDNKVMFVFGGCNGPQAIRGPNSLNAGDPIFGCPAQGLMNDLWAYVPPSTAEIVPRSFIDISTTTARPFNALTLLGNVFGTDTWLDHLPMFMNGNDPTNFPLTAPEQWRVLGNWIKLTPAGVPTLPTPRAGAAVSWDRAHHKIYVQGGFGCSEVTCASAPRALNDLWEYTPPVFDTVCPTFRGDGYCGLNGSGQGTWALVSGDNPASSTNQPTERYGGVMAFANPQTAHGDEFYTVSNAACQFQGPISSPDATVNNQLVGAIYVDVDRNQMAATDNLVINLRFLPFDQKTKLPGWSTNATPYTTIDDTDAYTATDRAVIRVQLLSNPLSSAEQIQSTVQPRFHEFISGTPVIGGEFMYVSGATGQVTEKQIHVPLTLSPLINLIKIERVTGSVKFFEMTISKF